jgi:hypothetical protein
MHRAHKQTRVQSNLKDINGSINDILDPEKRREMVWELKTRLFDEEQKGKKCAVLASRLQRESKEKQKRLALLAKQTHRAQPAWGGEQVLIVVLQRCNSPS